jgi:SAM-dependent methyltransferase
LIDNPIATKINIDMDNGLQDNKWNEQLTQDFIDYGRYFVPDRDEQIQVIVDLLPVVDESYSIIELCCGEGLLADAILEQHQNCRVRGYDGSKQMLEKASTRLMRFEDRFQPIVFDLADDSWRDQRENVQAVVTSLAVHHLVGSEKEKLSADVYKMLSPGGTFIIADIIDPNHPRSKKLAAKNYDQFVKERSIALDGNTEAFDFFQSEGWNIFHELDPEDIDKPSPIYDQLAWLHAAGFIHIDVFWVRAGHAIFGGWKGTDDEPK